MDAGVVADDQLGGIDETDAAALTTSILEVGEHNDQNAGNELDKSVVAHEPWELASALSREVIEIEVLEISDVGELEGDENGDDLALAQASPSSSCSWCGELVSL